MKGGICGCSTGMESANNLFLAFQLAVETKETKASSTRRYGAVARDTKIIDSMCRSGNDRALSRFLRRKPLIHPNPFRSALLYLPIQSP